MSHQTEHYQLVLPELSEQFSLENHVNKNTNLIDETIYAEETARKNADTSEKSRAENAESNLQNLLNQEAADRKVTDNALQKSIDDEVAAREAAVRDEKNRAENYEITLHLDDLAEKEARVSADSNLQRLLNIIRNQEVPIGVISLFGGGTSAVPENYLPCDGRAISRTDYADLFAVIGIKYGGGDGVKTFNLPNFKGRFPEGAKSDSTVGNYKEPGLPEIMAKWADQAQGCISTPLQGKDEYYNQRKNEWKGEGGAGITGCNNWADGNAFPTYNADGCNGATWVNILRASKGEMHNDKYENRIFGKSDTVQPASIEVNYIIKAKYSW